MSNIESSKNYSNNKESRVQNIYFKKKPAPSQSINIRSQQADNLKTKISASRIIQNRDHTTSEIPDPEDITEQEFTELSELDNMSLDKKYRPNEVQTSRGKMIDFTTNGNGLDTDPLFFFEEGNEFDNPQNAHRVLVDTKQNTSYNSSIQNHFKLNLDFDPDKEGLEMNIPS